MKVALGIGCDRGTPAATVAQCIAEALDACGATPANVRAVASIDLKADEHDFSGHWGILAMETVALRPSGPRRLCFSMSNWVMSAPAASSAAASATDGVPVYLRTVSDGLGTGTDASAAAG
jgi:hypothetical protein